MATLEAATDGRHLAHSHAHEEDIPGTVNLRAREGDDTGYGQALFPVPAEDPNDPLQWNNFKKTMILTTCALYSFLGNSALLGPSVYITIFAAQFGISENKASGLISYANLAFGFGSLLLVPLYHKFGRRPVMLFSLLCYCAGLIACSQADSYGGLMAARIIHAFGSGVCEALPVQLVNDIFFLHERGQRIGYYTVALCFGSTGPLFAGYMLNGGYSWRLFFYVEFAFACGLFLLAFFVVEETTYHRKSPPPTPPPPAAAAAAELSIDDNGPVEEEDEEKEKEKADASPVATMVEASSPRGGQGTTTTTTEFVPPRKTFLQTLQFWGVYERDADFFLMMARSFTYFLVPHVFWVVTTYGIYIGLGALSFNYIMPIKVTAAPYHWSTLNSGLISVATMIGYGAALPFTTSSDRLAARLTRRNGMVREAEMRLGVCLPAMLVAPAGLVVFGFTAARNLHWLGYFAGVVLTQWASYFYFTFVLSYALDSYPANTSEMLIAMNLGKQAISFGMGVDILEWVLEKGYAVMIAGVFGGVLLANNLALIPFMLYGKRIRIFMSRTWLAKIHKDSVREVMTA